MATATMEQPVLRASVVPSMTSAEMPEAFAKELAKNDPNFAKVVAAQRADKAPKKEIKDVVEDDGRGGETSGVLADGKDGDTDVGADGGSTTDVAEKTVAEETGQDGNQSDHKVDDPSDDEAVPGDESTPVADAEAEFEDNIIDGVPGATFAKLPKDVQVAIAKHVENSKSSSDENSAAQRQLSELLKDPVISARSQVIQQGQGTSFYQVPGLSPDAKKQIANTLGLDNEELAKIAPIVDEAVRVSAQAIIENDRIERGHKDSIESGRKRFLELQQFNPEFVLQEKDLSRIMELREKHPEWQKWQKGLGRYHEYFSKRKFNYQTLLDFSPKELYAMAAAELGDPVAINTEARDKKIVEDTADKILGRFRKDKTVARGLDKGSSNSQKPPPVGARHMKEGFDLIRLATDPAYSNAAMNKHAGDRDKQMRIIALTKDGIELLKKNKPKT